MSSKESKRVRTPLLSVKRFTYDGGNLLRDPLSSVDPEVYDILKNEKRRQRTGLQLTASENFVSFAVCEALGSSIGNKYYPGDHDYAENEFLYELEDLCHKRSLEVFGLDPKLWGVTHRPYSGSLANLIVYMGIAGSHGRIMGLDMSDGGHISHGYYSPSSKVSTSSRFFESLPYKVNIDTGLIDYNKLEESALNFLPKIIIAGITSYSRWLDYARFRDICDKCNAYLMADMAHISGLVAGGVAPSPFEYADIVTTTTHKTLRGPRGALIFYRKGVRSVNAKGENVMYDIQEAIEEALFPGIQGGPHNHTMAGMIVALKECLTTQFSDYTKQVVKNSQALARRLSQKGFCVMTGGTDNHLCVIDLRPIGLDSSRVETVLDLAHIVSNRNPCPGDTSAIHPSGIRFGSAALTSRGFMESDFWRVADFICQAIEIYQKHESKSGKTVKEFKEFLANDSEFTKEICALADEVEKFTASFDIPGINTELREVLMLQRGITAKFMPNSYVFPGGTLDRHDVDFPRDRTNFDSTAPQPLKIEGLADDFPLRVTAVRELFEESGLLMTANENCREIAIQSVADDPSLEEWRTKIYNDPHLFSHLFFGSTKMDVNSLIPWSNWLTPMKRAKTSRYDTVFFVVPTHKSHTANYCVNEMAESIWTQPSKIIEKSVGKGIVSLPPPQYYELLRVRLATCSLTTPLTKMVDPERIAPQVLLAEDDATLTCNLLPGDHLYFEGEEGIPREMVPTKTVPKSVIMHEAIKDEEGKPVEKPIHRMTYRSGGSNALQYVYHELHIKHIEKMPKGRRTHLFYYNEKDYTSFF